jgi:hypothetical protein
MVKTQNKIKPSWHYPRADLAQKYLKTFDIGLSSARGLFARRRMGKTEFLRKDLEPLAATSGYLVAYANFWDNKDAPEAALVMALARALEPTGLKALLAKVKSPLKKVKASGKGPAGIEGTFEAELNLEDAAATVKLADLLAHFDERSKPLLLLLDEAQVLARIEHSGFAHALRAALDVRKETIKVIFAGSAETTLRQMFGRPNEPFYNWAPLEPFPLLGDDFVLHCTDQVNALARQVLTIDEARQAFAELNRTPEFFRRFLEEYVVNQFDGFAVALANTKAKVYSDEQYVKLWSNLNVSDQIVLTMLAQGVEDLHSIASLAKLGEAMGKTADHNVPSNALKRLYKEQLVGRLSHGEYRFEDEGLADWVRRRAAARQR